MTGPRCPRRVEIGGTTLWSDDDQPTFWDRVGAGRWEPGTLVTLRRFVGPGTAFVDLGAWVGPLSLYAASLGARVVAVEADPLALDQLRRNRAANTALAGSIEVIPNAIAAEPGAVRLGARRKAGNSMSSALLPGAEVTWEAQAVTPAEVAAMVGGSGNLFVKLDIEGGEYGLLPAMGPLLREGVRLLVSFHPNILRESGEADVGGRTRAALATLEGWSAAPIGRNGPIEAAVPAATLDPDVTDTWLLSGPESD